MSLREWLLLLGRRKLAVLHESEPVWLPDHALAEAKPLRITGLFAVGFTLAKELSGEAQIERAQREAALCQRETAEVRSPKSEVRNGDTAEPRGFAAGCGRLEQLPRSDEQRIYLQVTENRFNGVRRCC